MLAPPSVSDVEPIAVPVDSGDTVLDILGVGFVDGAVVRWDGVGRATAFIDAGHLTATILSGDMTRVGKFPLTVYNPPPNGGVSESVMIEITRANIFNLGLTKLRRRGLYVIDPGGQKHGYYIE